MGGAAGCWSLLQASGRAGRAWWHHTGAAGSLVLRRMDRRERKRGLVRAKKHGTKSGTGAPLRRGFFLLPVGAANATATPKCL